MKLLMPKDYFIYIERCKNGKNIINITCNAICPGYFPTEKIFEKHDETEKVNMNNNQKLKSFIRHINVAIPKNNAVKNRGGIEK